MEQDQEQRQHVCKLCDKSFLSGKILGGHMRCHGTTHKKRNFNVGFEDGGQSGYGLRGNPKKTWRFSSPNENDDIFPREVKENVCNFCGEGFDSTKALFGHMRHHSSGERQKKRVQSACVNLILNGQLENEGLVSVRRKRSSRMRYNKVDSISTSYSSGLREKSSSFGLEPEEEELAMCLLMLSKGVSNWVGVDSTGNESTDNNSATFDANSLNQNDPILEPNDVFAEHDSGFTKDEEDSVILEIPSEGFCIFSDYKMPNLVDESKCLKKLDLARFVPVKCTPRKKAILYASDIPTMGNCSSKVSDASEFPKFYESCKKSEFICKICTKRFSSYQALGGHSTIHKRATKCGPTMEFHADCALELGHNEEEIGEMGDGKGHQCAICLKEFVSGRALGGHKRAHFKETVMRVEVEQQDIALKQQLSDICHL